MYVHTYIFTYFKPENLALQTGNFCAMSMFMLVSNCFSRPSAPTISSSAPYQNMPKLDCLRIISLSAEEVHTEFRASMEVLTNNSFFSRNFFLSSVAYSTIYWLLMFMLHTVCVKQTCYITYNTYTVEPLYKGQFGIRSFVHCREVVHSSEVKNVLAL